MDATGGVGVAVAGAGGGAACSPQAASRASKASPRIISK
jgi:hypothetical protein